MGKKLFFNKLLRAESKKPRNSGAGRTFLKETKEDFFGYWKRGGLEKDKGRGGDSSHMLGTSQATMWLLPVIRTPSPNPSNKNKKKLGETVKRLAMFVTETGKERTSTIPGHHTVGKWTLKDSRGTSHRNSETTDEATGHRHTER